MTEAIPFLGKCDITFLRPLTVWDSLLCYLGFSCPGSFNLTFGGKL